MSQSCTDCISLNELYERANEDHLAILEAMGDVDPIVLSQESLEAWDDAGTLRWTSPPAQAAQSTAVCTTDLDDLVYLDATAYAAPLPQRNRRRGRGWSIGLAVIMAAGGAMAAGLLVHEATATPRIRGQVAFLTLDRGPLSGTAGTDELVPRPATAAELERPVIAAAPVPKARSHRPRISSGTMPAAMTETKAAPANGAYPTVEAAAVTLPKEERRGVLAPVTATVETVDEPQGPRSENRGTDGDPTLDWTQGLFGATPGTAAIPELPALTREHVVEGLRPLTALVRNCTPEHVEDLVVQLQVQGATGRISNTVVTGELASSGSSRCIERALRRAQFPRFSQSQLQVRDYIFALR
jgi:hypothetical protein